LQARFYAADYAASTAATKVHGLPWTTSTFFEVAEYHFYSALARAASYEVASADERPQHREVLVAHQQQLALWAQHCAENFSRPAALDAAEIARIDGRDLEAMRLYAEAMRLARQHGFLQNEGLTNERAARFYAARGFETIAHAYLRNARYCYRRWGAEGKVRQLNQAYPHLREEPAVPRPTTTMGAPVEHLDLATVVKISQAVSGEIVLEQLINTLMTLAVEHAGAERGLLLLPHVDALWIAAEATTGRDAVTVRLRHAGVSGVELPVSVLHYVLRTQEPVLLDDAAAPNLFAADAYLRQTYARSVLCLPLLKQARLIGVLYLENRLASHDARGELVADCSYVPTRLVRKSMMVAPISRAWVSSAKWPVSNKWTSACGVSRRNASAPAGRKNGSCRPQTASTGGQCARKYAWNCG
jgi:GAF domain